MNNRHNGFLAGTLILGALLGGCVASVDNANPAKVKLGNAIAVTEDAMTQDWKLTVKADLDRRLPTQLNLALAEATPPEVAMADDVRAALKLRLADSFKHALDGVTPIAAP